MTAKKLAALLHEELDSEAWGDLDPELFLIIATEGDGYSPDDPTLMEAKSLEAVLDRCLARLSGQGA